MATIRAHLRELWVQQAGITTVEYALLLALVAVVALAAWADLGWETRRMARRAGRILRRAMVR